MTDIFVTAKPRDSQKKNEQYYKCKRANLPLVVIVPSGRFASVEIDMFSTDRNFDDETVDKICAVFRDYMDRTATIWHGATRCSVERVPIEEAQNVARKIYNIAYDALPTLKNCCGDPKPWRQRA
jgi:hypothetical protein